MLLIYQEKTIDKGEIIGYNRFYYQDGKIYFLITSNRNISRLKYMVSVYDAKTLAYIDVEKIQFTDDIIKQELEMNIDTQIGLNQAQAKILLITIDKLWD